MSEPAPETPKHAKRSTDKTKPTTAVEAEAVEETTPENQPAPAKSQPAVTATPAPLVIHNRPSTWLVVAGIAFAIFLFGYVTSVAISSHRTIHPTHQQGMRQQRDMRGGQMPRGNSQEQRGTSNVPSV